MRDLSAGTLVIGTPVHPAYDCPSCGLSSATVTAPVLWLGLDGVWPITDLRRCLRCKPA